MTSSSKKTSNSSTGSDGNLDVSWGWVFQANLADCPFDRSALLHCLIAGVPASLVVLAFFAPVPFFRVRHLRFPLLPGSASACPVVPDVDGLIVDGSSTSEGSSSWSGVRG